VLKNKLRTSTVVPGEQPQGAISDCLPATTSHLGAGRLIGHAAAEREAADFGDRGQCFAAEAERADAEQVVGVEQFAGGVAGDGQRQLFRRNAAAVVDDPNQFQAPLLYRDVDPRGAGVERVFQQFLDHAGRPLDDFAGGDLVDDQRG